MLFWTDENRGTWVARKEIISFLLTTCFSDWRRWKDKTRLKKRIKEELDET
jgi:hypothetical protein